MGRNQGTGQTDQPKTEPKRKPLETRETPRQDPPPSGPHAKEALTNDAATPGSGALPTAAGSGGDDVDGGVG
jgi:hypothetical protein